MKLKMLLLTGATCLSFLTQAQQLNTARLDSLFNILSTKDRAMGSVTIAKGNKVLYHRATGFSENTPAQVPATVETTYRIGSISKMFTAAIIFQLIEEHKLSLDNKLSEYYPQIPHAAKITIGQMLGHRSGIANMTDDERYMTFSRAAKSRQQIVDFISAIRPAFPPDSTAEYSNSNYILLGYIAEHICKQPYARILKERITDRAGLKHTFFAETPNRNETASFNWEDGWKKVPATDMSIPGGAGAVLSTPDDLVQFLDALFNGRIVSRESLQQMEHIRDGYGMGMFTFPFGNKTFYGHNGGIDGFSSSAARNLSDSVTIAYCTNGTRFSTNNVMIALLSIYYNKPYELPSFNSVTLSATALDQYTGTYASGQIPLKITVSKNGNKLQAQATGQPAFPLEATGKDRFEFSDAGVVMEFEPAAGKFILKQGGGSFAFQREATQK